MKGKIMDAKFDGWPHVVCAQQFAREWITGHFFPLAKNMEKISKNRMEEGSLKGKRLLALFYEPSTRTRFSFEMAMFHLGGQVCHTESAGHFSSAVKGETLKDTILVLNQLEPDIIVLRHNIEGSSALAASLSSVPIINAGDGIGQHPTQALLDIYTIYKKFGTLDGISIAMVGDLMNGRTVRSLSYLLGKFNDVKIHFVSPSCAQMKTDIKDYLLKHEIEIFETNDLRDVAKEVDVIYQTRTQKERGTSFDRNDHNLGYFSIDKSITNLMKEKAIIMHPLPRVDEINTEVDNDPRAVYLTDQVRSGLHARMALLKMILAPDA